MPIQTFPSLLPSFTLCQRHLSIFKMSSTQPTTARTLVAFGAFSQFVGMVLGMFVPAMPFPRLGLTGHISWMTTGNLCLTTGLVLYQPNLVPISAPLLQYVKWAFFSGIIVMISETLNAFWGTNQFLTIVRPWGFLKSWLGVAR